jgi:membrane protease YdiL (CAAX protease family)
MKIAPMRCPATLHPPLALVLLATIAGLFYGAAYLRTRRIEGAILTHFALNAAHFLAFTYPALAGGS